MIYFSTWPNILFFVEVNGNCRLLKEIIYKHENYELYIYLARINFKIIKYLTIFRNIVFIKYTTSFIVPFWLLLSTQIICIIHFFNLRYVKSFKKNLNSQLFDINF